MKAKQISAMITGKDFDLALAIVGNNLQDAEREPMGLDAIARFTVKEKEYSHIMFFNHSGKASEPSFCFND